MIWVAGRSPTLVSHSLRGVAMNLKATTLTYLAIEGEQRGQPMSLVRLNKLFEKRSSRLEAQVRRLADTFATPPAALW